MFKFVCLFALVAATCGASIRSAESSTEKREIVPLLSYERENNPDGSFKFSYEGADQSFREETAHVINAGTEDEALEVSGSYRYIDEDGRTVEVSYTAGKNGFVPVGTNILPEISAAAKAAAEANEREPERKKRSSNNGAVDEPKESKLDEKAEVPKVENSEIPVIVVHEEEK